MTAHPLLWLVDAALLAGLWLLGILAARLLMPRSDFFERLSLGYGLGLGLYTWLLFLLSWVGMPLTVPTISVLFLLLAGLLFAAPRVFRRGGHPFRNPPAGGVRSADRSWDLAGWVLLGGLGLVLAYISVGLSYYPWDAMAIWSVKGYGIGLEHSIQGALQWGAKGIGYPLNIPISINIFYLFDQDLLPGSKLLFPGFLVAMLAGLRIYLGRRGLPAWLAWCAAFAIGTIPLLLQYSLTGYANGPFAYYYVLGVLWIGLGLDGDDLPRVITGAVLLALSIWTRLEGLQFWLIAVLGLALVWRTKMVSKKALLSIVLPALAVGGSWSLFGRLGEASTPETAVLGDALKRLLHGEFHPEAFYQIVRFTGYLVIRTKVYGILVPTAIGLALLLVAALRRLRKDILSLSVLVAGLLTGAGVVFMYYLTSYSREGLEWWLGTGYDRMLFGTVSLLAAASAPFLWQAVSSSSRAS